jgi:hypothetical protein
MSQLAERSFPKAKVPDGAKKVEVSEFSEVERAGSF